MPTPNSSRRRLGRRFSTSGATATTKASPPTASNARWQNPKYSTISHDASYHPEPRRTASSPAARTRSRTPLRDLFVKTEELDVNIKEEEDWVYSDHEDYGQQYHSDDATLESAPLPTDGFPTRPSMPRIHSDSKVLAYASLPPTPLSTSPPTTSPPPDSLDFVTRPEALVPSIPTQAMSWNKHRPFSIWDYLKEELIATDFDEHQEMKWERVSNFLSIPLAMEKIIGFGFILCFDSFLYTFTIQPIRFLLAFFRLCVNAFKSLFTWSPRESLPPSQKADIIRTVLLLTSLAILVPLTDASKIYHSIRGQDTIKLYVIFNALEIADRLLASIGQDILDCLFARATLDPLSAKVRLTKKTFKPISFFVMAVAYVVAHTLVLIYQTISLNVAVNAYDHALLTLLVSNQFVEIKGSVFKKFEKDNLFQITCADIVERFTLTLMLIVVAFRNLIELSGSAYDWTTEEGVVLPKSFLLPKRLAKWVFSLGWMRGSLVWTILYPVLTVLLSEMLVDWLKHAFITKFNHIRPSIYGRYTDVLCGDLKGGWTRGRKHQYVDQSPVVARRLGFASLPLAVLAILIGSQSLVLFVSMQSESIRATPSSSLPTITGTESMTNKEVVTVIKWSVLGILFWLCSVVVKIILGINLVSYARRRQAGTDRREAEDVVNDWARDPIGEGEEEKKYNRALTKYLDNKRDDASPTAEIGERKLEIEKGGDGGKKKRLKLEEITRFTMVKRIW